MRLEHCWDDFGGAIFLKASFHSLFRAGIAHCVWLPGFSPGVSHQLKWLGSSTRAFSRIVSRCESSMTGQLWSKVEGVKILHNYRGVMVHDVGGNLVLSDVSSCHVPELESLSVSYQVVIESRSS